ncbi:MAG: TRAP transporter large permease [Burkholderiaceae bacterium]|nr:TRAP transporter large permease [Burkholderiaceae bacterium]
MLGEFTVLLGAMLVALALGMPVFLCLALSIVAYAAVYWPKLPPEIIVQGFLQGVDSYSLLAIPFFFLVGEILNVGGIGRRLVDVATAIAGHIRGGLSHVNVLVSMVFAGISGSAIADASAVGSLMIPAMKRAGYPGPYSAAVTAAAATMGPIIPPSIPFVLYAFFSQTSVSDLFLAGIVPGLLMGVFLLAATVVIGVRRNYPSSPWPGWRLVTRALVYAAPAVVLPILIVAGVVSGVATVTEIGALAALYAAAISLVNREITLAGLWRATCRAGMESCRVLIVLSVAGTFIWIMGNMNLAQGLASALMRISGDPLVILALIAIFLLVVGCFLDPVTILLVFVPMFMPVVRLIGVDPIHFGVVAVFAMSLGLLTPPVGFLIYLTAAQAQASSSDVIRELVVFIAAQMAMLGFLVAFPALSTALPNMLAGR